MLQNLSTEAPNPASEGIDALSPLEIVKLMNSEDAGIAGAVLSEAERIAAAIEIIADRLREGGRLIYLGAGTSGRLGVLDAAECPPTFNSPPGQVIGLIAGGASALTRAVEGAEDHPEFAVADLEAIGVGERDVVVGIASSGRTPYVLGGLKYARERQAFTIGFSCNAEPELAGACNLTITPIVGPEVISGSTRLKAGTATKLALNMLTTGAMVRLGKTYGNLMVDLRATNQKLLERTRRIVMLLAGLDADQADSLLAQCDGELKTAVVVHKRSVSVTQAREVLARASGHLRRALSAECESGRLLESRDAVASASVNESRSLVLGIDGGGSKTAAWLSRKNESGEWTIVGRGVAGASNPQAVGFAMAFCNLDSAVNAAFANARLACVEVAAACGALAGAERESDRRQVERWAHERRLAAKLQFVHDALPLLAAGTPAGHGVALIAGTGSFAFGQNARGETARAGGWGYLIGDEGSGYSIALAALRRATWAADERGPATRLLPRFLKELGSQHPLDLIGAIYQSGVERRTIAAWADFVFEEAAAGDNVAAKIISQAAHELAEAVAAVCRQIGFVEGPFPLALGGGLVVHRAAFRENVENELRRLQFHADPVGRVPDPVLGAVILAQRICENRIFP
jgi:N-acetylmuramic acid 6-phosphate etherase